MQLIDSLEEQNYFVLFSEDKDCQLFVNLNETCNRIPEKNVREF